ncbi:MAG TPA: LOG family protein, partial [Phenylobacterium sp.]|nr:LOG family protein [Phenylobacterium sp.]
LDLHAKPVVFWSPNGFWDPLFALFQHTVDHRFTPPEFMESWVTVEAIEDVVPALLAPSGAAAVLAPEVARLS